MKFETVLNATLKTNFNFQFYRNLEKYYKFRAWLLRHEEQQREEMAELSTLLINAQKEIARLIKLLSTERSLVDNAPVWAELANCPPYTVIGIRYEQIIKWTDEIARLKARVATLERIMEREAEKNFKTLNPYTKE